MKKVKFLVGLLFIATLSFTGCQTDPVSENIEEQADFEIVSRASEENVTIVKHNYNYYGERFSVQYTLNNDSGEVQDVAGDTERAENLFSNADSGPQAMLFSNLADIGERAEPSANATQQASVVIDVQLYNTTDEMEADLERTVGNIPREENASVDGAENCTSADIWGQGNFYFYKHINYSTEMLPLRRTSRYYFRNHWVGSSYNDQMSSLIVTKPYYRRSYTTLYQHICFGGKTLSFYQGPGSYGFGVPNLKWYTLSGWWWWRTSWNDQVSSIRGYSW